jgi:ADP-heptose:LPS heptosyltransferase
MKNVKEILVWFRPGAIGDIIMTTNMLKNFKAEHPHAKLVYCCGKAESSILLDYLSELGFLVTSARDIKFDRVFNLVGYPIPTNTKNPGNYPREPMKKHLISYFADDLEVEPDCNSLCLSRPDFPMKRSSYVTIQVVAGWSPYKMWGLNKWNDLCYLLSKAKIHTVQIGGAKDIKIPNVCSKITGPNPNLQFNTCLAAIANARLHIGLDSWANHATNIRWGEDERRTPGVILWGSTQLQAAGYGHNTNVWKHLHCGPCFREDPKVSSTPLGRCRNPEHQTYENPKHACMENISVKVVYEAVIKMWDKNK